MGHLGTRRAERMKRPLTPRIVYFLRPVGEEGPVKIGSTGIERLARRLSEIAKHSPFPLEVAAAISADMGVEFRLHGFFAGQRTHYEWFSASPRLSQLIASLQAGTPIHDAI